mgnify:CR=1 FL=1
MKDLILMAAIPLFLGLIALEYWIDRNKGSGHYRFNDAFGSLSLGIMSRTTNLVLLSLGALFIDRILPEARWFEWSSSSPLTWVATFVLYDFCYYWTHRMGHTLNLFWAGHSVHHQSEDYNLTTALRQTSSSIWTWIFSVPLLMLGAPVEVFLTCGALNLIYQFWVHTQHIDKLGWMEHVMVTPSNHRVHHGQNPEYIDKNHGGVFILWDRMFGSFQPELDDIDIIYGVRSPLQSFNPVRANLQVWSGLIHDAWHARSWWDKLRIWFMPTGWRPQDVERRYPVKKSDLQAFKKFDPEVGTTVRNYGLFQLAAAVPLLVYFMLHFEGLSYLLISLGFVMISLPLVTTGWMLEGRGDRWEKVRVVVSWVGFGASWGLMAPSSVAVFGGYLVFNSIALLWLMKSPRDTESLVANHS